MLEGVMLPCREFFIFFLHLALLDYSHFSELYDMSRVWHLTSKLGQCSSVVEQLFRNLKVGYIPELTRGNLYIYSPKTKDYQSSTTMHQSP